MFHKALWMQNYKQSKLMVWVIFVIMLFHFPFNAMTTVANMEEQIRLSVLHSYDYTPSGLHAANIFNGGALSLMMIVSTIILASLLIGVERNTRRNDFTFSLPFKRRDLFLAKWLFGTLVIASFHLFHFTLGYVVFSFSDFGYLLNEYGMIELYLSPLLSFILVFSFALFIGTVAGEMISQVVLSFIFGIFPTGFFMLITGFFYAHGGRAIYTYQGIEDELVARLTVFSYPFVHTDTAEQGYPLILMIIGIMVLIYAGTALYNRSRVEHNGEFLLIKELHPVFLVGIVICFALLGGFITSGLFSWSGSFRLGMYWIGYLTFGLFSYLIAKRLLSMNLTVRNR
ncbi:ABC-2 transporter permease [Alteribacter natronophilus]|uniref:ABC-2 transporter permease n=1 Tax=Alteribacter natronophilus TaxID=2583810 RepID=UPI00110D3B7C|nr:ABC-2 transporter permease [Alteribacter natronophilus]TMW70282.1 hypothetical protein FGB90_16525 [Alteribacter natronophilus]